MDNVSRPGWHSAHIQFAQRATFTGRAAAVLDGERIEVTRGDALVVPPNRTLSLTNPHDEPFEAVCVFPVGGQGRDGG